MSYRSVRVIVALLASTSLVFFAPPALPDPNPRESLSRGDFNGDGRPDLLTQPAGRDRDVTLQLGNAVGTLDDATKWSSGAFGLDWSAQGSRVLVGDFNGDGQPEMFVQSLERGGTSALIRAGRDGRPESVAQVIPADLLGWEWSGDRVVPVAGDFDGNGRDEVLLQSIDEFGVHYVMLTNESGEFAAHGQGWIEDYLDLRWTAPASALHTGDFNGDGHADLLLQPMDEPRPGHPNDALYALLLADEQGRFEQISTTWDKDAFGAEWAPSTHELIVRDVDGDRIADVWLRAYSATGTNFLVMGRASGRFDNADLKWTGDQAPETVYARERAGQTEIVVDQPGNSDGKGPDKSEGGDRPSMTAMMSNQPSPSNPTDPGTLKGEFSVDPTGTANYRIPISVPPGVAGMQPDLAFLYSSRAGNGHLGVGWSISGLSAITRCPATIDQDGLTTMQGVTLTQSDKFCLDGQRLIVNSGTYGANGTVYHTEIASFQRATATVTNAANGPDSFEVKDKAGLVRTYGTAHGVDAKIEAAPSRPQVLVWALNRISDRNGNYIQFNYSEDTVNGEYRPTLISYHNRLGTQIGRVEIGYESRPDTRYGYMLTGAKKALTQRANEVRTFDGGTLVSSYRLLYGTSSKSGLSQLSSIQRCNVAIGTGGARCLAATTFGWQDGQRGFAVGPLWDTLPSTITNVKPVDINGNGSMELVYAKNGVWNIKTGYNYNSVETTTSISTSASHIPYALGIDVNSDGYQDFAIPHDSGHALGAKWGFYLSAGTELNSTAAFSVPHEGAHDKKPVVVDVDGDVRPELVFKKNQQLWVYKNVGGSFSTANSQAIITGSPILGDQDVTPIEWDGDGRPDLYINGRNCLSSNSCWNNVGVWRNNGNYSFSKVSGTALKKPILGDINGDGLTDLVDFETSVLKVYSNIGGAWALTTTTQTSNYGDSAQVTDYNEDGKQDILVPRGDDRWHAYFWNESTLTFIDEDTGTPVVDRPSSSMFDFDGNGKADIMYLVAGNGWKVRAQNQQLSGLITQFTDGDQAGLGVKGVQATATYAALAHVYGGKTTDGLGGSPVTAPQTRHFNSPIPVVRFSSLSSGAPNPVFTSYTYTGAKLNQYGRGFLGFREVKANNAGTGIVTSNTHRQDFPFTGMIEAATQDTPSTYQALYTQGDLDRAASDLADLCLYDWETKLCQYPPAGTTNSMIQVIPGVRVTSTTSTLHYYPLAEGYFPFVDESTTDTFELNGGARYRREVTDFTYGDGWGNPTQIFVTTSDGNGGDPHTTNTVNTYTNDSSSNWILSRLTQSSVTTSVPGSGSGVRNSSFTYAAIGANGAGQMTSERVEAGTALEMSKTYEFDQFGNRVSETVGGYGVNARQTQFGYDSNGRFITSITNPLGHAATQTWDGRFGVVATATDPNGNSAASTHDPFGRKTQETGPRTGTARYVNLQLCTLSACTASARGAIWKSTSSDSAGRVSTTEYDMFDREIFTRTLDWRTDITRYVNTETAYDDRGRAYLKAAPYFDGAPRCWSQVVYDKVNRAVQEKSPAAANECVAGAAGSTPPSSLTLGRAVTTAYSVNSTPGFNSLSTTRADPTMTRTTSTWFNSMGRTVRVSEVDEASQTLATTFQYDQWGNTKAVTDPNGVVRSMTYNARGFKLTMSDPDMGNWSYGYNAFGELVSQIDAKNQSVTMAYDALGRMISRSELEGSTTWTYDTGGYCLDASGNASSCSSKGRLISVTGPGPIDTGGIVTESYAYDTFGAVRQSLRTIDGKAFWTTYGIDAEGRVSTIRYPDINPRTSVGAVVHSRPADDYQFIVQNHYQRGAHFKTTAPGGASPVYWELKDTTAWGAETSSQFGNSFSTATSYDTALQLPTAILSTRPSDGASAMNHLYTWNLAGNLTRRVDNWSGHAEDFSYDRQHRLKQVVLDYGYPTGPVTYTNSYDLVGRLTSRYASASAAVAVTNYQYSDAAHRHAVTSVSFGGTTAWYGYDANGNATSGRGLPVSWMSFNMPYEIGSSAVGAWSRFAYGPDRSRWKQTIQSPASGLGTTYYVGSLFEREERGIAQLFRYHIFGGGKAVAYHTYKAGAATTNYLHRDHLGSVVGMSDAGASGREFYSYDAWGKRRSPYTWASYNAWQFLNSTLVSNADGYRRGYTGHEMLDHLGLVHMNGRIYDPEIGRFLSADPIVQYPESTQGYDRYQYVANNPLSATDPSGHVIMAVYAIAVAAAELSVAEYVVATIAAAAIGYVETGGNVQASVLYAATIGTSGYIGTTMTGTTKVIAGALAGGALSVAGGGRFGDGFLGGLAGGVAGSGALGKLAEENILVAAIVGGSVSVIGGGKFANGAISAAFVYAFGNAASSGSDMTVGSAPGSTTNPSTFDVSIEASNFATADEAARAFGDQYGPDALKTSREHNTGIVKLGDKNYGYTRPVSGNPGDTTVRVRGFHRALREAYGGSYEALAHTHFDMNLNFSSYDVEVAKVVPLYLRNQGGETRLLNEAIMHRTVRGIAGADPIGTYMQFNSTMPGKCLYGCN